MDIIGNINDEYKHRNDILPMKKTTKGMEKMKDEFTDAENECRDQLTESKEESSVASSSSGISRRAYVNYDQNMNKLRKKKIDRRLDETKFSSELRQDMWEQIKRV